MPNPCITAWLGRLAWSVIEMVWSSPRLPKPWSIQPECGLRRVSVAAVLGGEPPREAEMTHDRRIGVERSVERQVVLAEGSQHQPCRRRDDRACPVHHRTRPPTHPMTGVLARGVPRPWYGQVSTVGRRQR